MRPPLAIVLVSISLSGCATPLFAAKEVNTDYRNPGNGILYALPKGLVSLTIERKIDADKSPILTVTMAEPELVPDGDHLFFLHYDHAALSNDKVKVETNKRGLITAVTTTTKDPIPAAVREFANFVIGVATQGVAASPVAGAAPTPEATGIEPFKVQALFDPSRLPGCVPTPDGATVEDTCDTPALKALKDYLRQFDVTLTVDRPPSIGLASANAAGTDCREMVCYRFVLPYRIVVDDLEGSRTRAESIVLLPNEGPVAGIKVVRRSLVENKLDLTFDNGVLTKADYDDPSALVGALSIPIDVLKTIVSIPSALFRFTIARDTSIAELDAKQNLLEAQTALATKQLELMKAEQALKDAQSGNTASP